MRVTVKLFNALQRFGPDIEEREIADESTVGDVIQGIAIPPDIPLLRIVNGVHVKPGHVLKEGDTLALFPPIAGGAGPLMARPS